MRKTKPQSNNTNKQHLKEYLTYHRFYNPDGKPIKAPKKVQEKVEIEIY